MINRIVIAFLALMLTVSTWIAIEHPVSNRTVVTNFDSSALPTYKEIDLVQPEIISEAIERNRQLHCLALNIYYESRGEPLVGQYAVALVTINRVKSPRFPDDICAVIEQKRNGVCQFSWVCQQVRPITPKVFAGVMRVAKTVFVRYYEQRKMNDIVHGSTHYHADYVEPYWAKTFTMETKIGRHLFYRESKKSGIIDLSSWRIW